MWKVNLSSAVQRDYEDILSWTLDNFGVDQVHVYDATLLLALEDLHAAGPALLGVTQRDEISPDICTLHVARKGRKGRHFLMFRANQDERTLEVLRILHDRMDLAPHLATDDFQ